MLEDGFSLLALPLSMTSVWIYLRKRKSRL